MDDLAAWARHLAASALAEEEAGPAPFEWRAGPRLLPGPDSTAGQETGLLRWLASGDLPTAFAAAAEDAPALFLDGAWLSHGELRRRAAGVHAALAGLGVVSGERVVLCGDTSAGLVAGYLGLLRAGAIVVLANPAYTTAELAHLVRDSGARRALADPEPAARLAELVDDVLPLDASPEPTALDPAEPGPDAVAMIAYTSGTTGEPKGVVLTHANLLSSIRAAMLAWAWRADDVLVHALPLSHQHGLGGVHATLLAGSRAVVLRRFDPAELAAAAEEHRATVLFAVPAMYQRICADAAVSARLRGTLRLAVCGSAPLPPELGARVTEALGRAPLERYGSTEAGLDVSLPLRGPGAVGTVGLPLPGVRMRLGERGEVLLRGPQVFGGYWNNPAATAEAFDEDGWFRTGDQGEREPDTGYLRLTGRLKELIITGGMNVAPREVELALEDHPSVAEVAVAGVASARWGEEVTAWVVPAPGTAPTERELIEHAERRLARYKLPKRVYLVGALPRTGMGKLRRGDLRPPEHRSISGT
ncbi:class I adenylate-forming enzyme family protein [Pseudonocardia acaciae]|uniref:class I adenylate-forming enzyme family protein n=1 Tax=Pseudonocardia acaciae TaxID=551276 RepID=UPI000A05A88A|nr:AMP-binding protein [Pseudonocardia acaciae]